MLAHHGGVALAQQLIVVKQAARYGVLDGANADNGRVALDVLKHLLEGGATDKLYLLALEILMGGDVVERPQLALYCYSLHCVVLLIYAYLTKNGPTL